MLSKLTLVTLWATASALVSGRGASAASVDWRLKGAIPPVRNQGQMGNPAALATVDLFEAMNTLGSGGRLVELSLGEAADCINVTAPVQSILDLGGLCSAQDYPRATGKCGSGRCIPAFSTTGWSVEAIAATTVAAAKAAVDKGPILVAVDASSPVFQDYRAGVLDSAKCGTLLDHVMMIVGYNDDASSPPFWIVRNSWGTMWGESGYMRIAMNNDNICGVLSMPVGLSTGKEGL